MKCDELKAYTYDDMIDGDADTNIEYYPKSDADAIIAQKDKEIAELKKKLMPCLNGDCILTCEVVEKYGKENAELKAKLDENRHQKYKRCLAMAEFCQYRRETFFTWSKKMGFLLKWQNRWHELAEKFKEAK